MEGVEVDVEGVDVDVEGAGVAVDVEGIEVDMEGADVKIPTRICLPMFSSFVGAKTRETEKTNKVSCGDRRAHPEDCQSQKIPFFSIT